MNKLVVPVKWSGDPTNFRSNVIGGMQIEAFRRATNYGFPQKWEYTLRDRQGQIVCFGLAYTKTAIKQVSLEALKKRLIGG